MMYKKNFVAVIRCNGQILRELDDVVTLPFGSDYSILMKNLDSRRVQVGIEIDGRDILDRKLLVIDGGKETELSGYMDGFSARNKFRFIQKTKEIADHRGDRIDDGLIVITYQFEKKALMQRETALPICAYHSSYGDGSDQISEMNFLDTGRSIASGTYTYTNNSNITATASRGMGMAKKMSRHVPRSYPLKKCPDVGPQPQEDEGITVKGAQINQRFRQAWIGDLEETISTISLKLRGYTGRQEMVNIPITVKTRIQCETCGRTSRSNAKFCNNCGTSLI